MHYKQNDLDEKIKAAAEERGVDVPDSIAETPELDEYQDFLYRAYFELHTCRSYSFGGEGPIPWTAIEEFCDRQGIRDLDHRTEIIFIVREMDKEFRDYMRKKREAEREARERKSRIAPPSPRPRKR